MTAPRAAAAAAPGRGLRSAIAWSTPDRIGVRGHDLVRDLIGKVNLGDMGFLEITGRLPDAQESAMFNALLVTPVEDGIVPSTLAARMTVAGAPEALQAAVAAGLVGHSPEAPRQPLAPEVWHRTEDEAVSDICGQLRTAPRRRRAASR